MTRGKRLALATIVATLALGTNGAGGAVMLFHPHELFPLPDDSQPLAAIGDVTSDDRPTWF